MTRGVSGVAARVVATTLMGSAVILGGSGVAGAAIPIIPDSQAGVSTQASSSASADSTATSSTLTPLVTSTTAVPNPNVPSETATSTVTSTVSVEQEPTEQASAPTSQAYPVEPINLGPEDLAVTGSAGNVVIGLVSAAGVLGLLAAAAYLGTLRRVRDMA